MGVADGVVPAPLFILFERAAYNKKHILALSELGIVSSTCDYFSRGAYRQPAREDELCASVSFLTKLLHRYGKIANRLVIQRKVVSSVMHILNTFPVSRTCVAEAVHTLLEMTEDSDAIPLILDADGTRTLAELLRKQPEQKVSKCAL